MNLLLDTHIWIWSAADPLKINPRVHRALDKSSNEKWLSPISIWELFNLVEKGRVKVDTGVDDWVRRNLETNPIREAPLTKEVALATRTFQLRHRDPADAFILATAKVFDLTLVTSDERLFESGEVKILSNR